jgi:CBS domain-containing protein
MLVRDLMHEGLITCPPEAKLGEVAQLLLRNRIHAVVVVDRRGDPVGVLSDSDLLAGEWLATDLESFEMMRTLTADELMTTPVTSIEADAPASEAALRLRNEHLSRFVVAEDGQAVGVIAVSDFVRALAHASTRPSTVADVMSRTIVVAHLDTHVPDLARGMSERRSRSVVVLDRRGRARGVVTGHDLLEADPEMTAEQLMQPPITISPAATLREAADSMVQNEVHRLVVADPGELHALPLGLVSTYDIVAEMAEPGSRWVS